MKIHEFLESGRMVRVTIDANDTRANEIKVTGFARGPLGETHSLVLAPKGLMKAIFQALNHYNETEQRKVGKLN